MTEFERMATVFENAGGTIPLAPDAPPALVETRWLLEEYRVSVFAQRLGTAQPVSPQRIRRPSRGFLTVRPGRASLRSIQNAVPDG